MAWNSVAENAAVNIIAHVEGAGAWDAINMGDPITIGVMQWYGTRAAALLTKIKDDVPAQYALIHADLRADHAANPDNSSYWTRRYLTVPERDTLKPVLRHPDVKTVQGEVIRSDIVDYKNVAENTLGVDVDEYTESVIFFCCMYHQSPREALRIYRTAGKRASLDTLYGLAYNNQIFRPYRSRYTQARDMIRTGNIPDIIDLNDDDDDIGDDGQNSGIGPDDERDPFTAVRTSLKRIEVVGDRLLLHLADGKTAFADPTGGTNFYVKGVYDGVNVEPTPTDPDDVPDPDDNPDPPTGDNVTDKQNALRKFMVDRTGTLRYSQNMRLRYPISSGYCDCSSLVRSAYEAVLGINPGSYTDAQVTSRNTFLVQTGFGPSGPDESKMKVGDLVITARHGTLPGRLASHVEMYIGNGRIIGHGGVPYLGPVQKDLQARTRDKRRWWIKRANGM